MLRTIVVESIFCTTRYQNRIPEMCTWPGHGGDQKEDIGKDLKNFCCRKVKRNATKEVDRFWDILYGRDILLLLLSGAINTEVVTCCSSKWLAKSHGKVKRIPNRPYLNVVFHIMKLLEKKIVNSESIFLNLPQIGTRENIYWRLLKKNYVT